MLVFARSINKFSAAMSIVQKFYDEGRSAEVSTQTSRHVDYGMLLENIFVQQVMSHNV
jgi:hypothetical protein